MDRSGHRPFTRMLPYLALVVAVGAWIPSAATAQDPPAPSTFESPRGLALGTGVRASAASTSAAAYNPAGLPLGRLYHMEAFSSFDPSFGRWVVGGSIVDSMTQKLAASLSFRGVLGGEDSGYGGWDGRLGLGFPLSDALSIGVAGRYVSLDAEGQADPDADPSLVEGFTLDAAIDVRPVESFRIALLGENLIDLDSSLTPTRVGGGIAISAIEAFAIGADVLVDLTTFDHTEWLAGGGVEYLVAGAVPLRAGYEYDHGRRLHTVTGGIGYVSDKVGVDLSVRQGVAGGDDTRVMAGLRYFVK